MAKGKFVKYSDSIKTTFKYDFKHLYNSVVKTIQNFRRHYNFDALFTDLLEFLINSAINGFFIIFGLHFLFGVEFNVGTMFGVGFLYLLFLRTIERFKP